MTVWSRIENSGFHYRASDTSSFLLLDSFSKMTSFGEKKLPLIALFRIISIYTQQIFPVFSFSVIEQNVTELTVTKRNPCSQSVVNFICCVGGFRFKVVSSGHVTTKWKRCKDPYGVKMRCACYLCLLLPDKQPLMWFHSELHVSPHDFIWVKCAFNPVL